MKEKIALVVVGVVLFVVGLVMFAYFTDPPSQGSTSTHGTIRPSAPSDSAPGKNPFDSLKSR